MKDAEKVFKYITMEINMKGIGRTIKKMDLENYCMRRVDNIKECGKTTKSMELASKYLLMIAYIKDIKEIGLKVKCEVWEN